MVFEEWLESLPKDKKVAVLVRHAQREPIIKVEDAVAARLTPQGMEDARRLGEKLALFSPLKFYHSPIERCRQTAESLARGASAKGADVHLGGSNSILGGPYMRDWDRVMKWVIEKGAGSFVRAWFAGELSQELVVEPHRAARQQLEVLLGQLRGPDRKCLLINVSHDWNVLLLRYFYLDDQNTRWPDYLEALALWSEGEGFVLQQGERNKLISL